MTVSCGGSRQRLAEALAVRCAGVARMDSGLTGRMAEIVASSSAAWRCGTAGQMKRVTMVDG